MSFSVTLLRSVKQAALNHCIKQYPFEACGFMLGALINDRVQVNAFVPIGNVAKDPLHYFSMDPASIMPYLFPKGSKEPTIVGIVHSHPDSPAIPSNEDLQTAWLHIPTHWIVSLLDPHTPIIHAYRYETAKQAGVHFHSVPWSVIVD
ncbi:M67 family metallopeptidase [Paenibacillus sp. RC67]|uniref:M67 family metallopeptidase n=1 Tax=Paenibacillus sp. RC67 TaxID=3039392 RepID=UPI0024AE14E4|nr:M67 family metallopeptidase [Paenibacillus sp. RC67]